MKNCFKDLSQSKLLFASMFCVLEKRRFVETAHLHGLVLAHAISTLCISLVLAIIVHPEDNKVYPSVYIFTTL